MIDVSADGENPCAGLDTSAAHSARVWNYLLGGKDHFEPDREVGNQILQTFPGLAVLARLQRGFLKKSVRFLAEEKGIRQFLDIGTGLPTADNTHEVAQAVAPESRIVYVDNDPMVLAHARALLTSRPEGATSYIEADVRDPDEVLAGAARTLDFSRPVALFMLSILGQLPDSDDPHELLARYLGALAPGSCLALCDGMTVRPDLNQAIDAYNQTSASSYHLRTPEQVAAYFDGLELVPPGPALITRWLGGEDIDLGIDPAEDTTLCGIGLKR